MEGELTSGGSTCNLSLQSIALAYTVRSGGTSSSESSFSYNFLPPLIIHTRHNGLPAKVQKGAADSERHCSHLFRKSVVQ